MKLTIYNAETLSKAIGTMRSEYAEHKYLRVSITSGKQRSIQMNALLHSWMQQISLERGEYTPGQVKAECKLRFGVPIMRRDDLEFAQTYDAEIKPLPYETKLHIMSLVPLTSRMTNKQLKEFLEEVQVYFSGMPTDPVELEWPEEA